jgi:hypothetical protein
MKLLPKSPLDSSSLETKTGRGCGYFEESGPKQVLFTEKEQRGRKERERERAILTLTILTLTLTKGVRG